MKKVAVIGAGLAGVASCYYLLQHNLHVTLFDPSGIAGGASGVSAGLLHVFTGPEAKYTWRGKEAMEEALKLLTHAPGTYLHQGVFRPATTPLQEELFLKQAQKHNELQWYEKEDTSIKLPSMTPFPGLWIADGTTVYTKPYLEALWKECEKQGATLDKHALSPSEFPHYDAIIVAAGPSSKNFFPELPLFRLKGQLLLLEWPKDLAPPPCSVVGDKYLVMKPDMKRCLVGATYERGNQDPNPNLEIAKADIMPKILELFPQLESANILEVRAGFRTTSPLNPRPYVKRVDEKTWVFSGLGSRGLLYHALCAKELSQEIAAFLSL